jgi:neutral ceramidase
MMAYIKASLLALHIFVAASLSAGAAFAQDAGQAGLKAGAGMVDITPAVEDLPKPLTSIHDHIFARALIVESGGQRAVIAVAEVPAIAADIYGALVQQISDQFHVPVTQVMLGTTHTHNSLRVAPPGNSPIPTSETFTAAVKAGVIEAIRKAEADLQPARSGYDSGSVSLVLGRDEWSKKQHRYIDGVDRTGLEAVDQTLGVHKFESLDGRPIAVVLNYGIEPVVYEPAKTEISGDVPGVTSRYIEDALGGKAVALFTVGSPATPAYRVWFDEDPSRTAKTAERIMDAMGVILGEEALARMSRIESSDAALPIFAVSDSLTCPGKQTTPRNLRTMCAYTEGSELPACDFVDAPFNDVTLTMGVLRLGDVAYVTADGNVVPRLWDKLRLTSPLKNTLFVGTNFGPFRFVVDDAAYALRTYPATDTRAAVGCAEQGFLSGALGLIEQSR